MVEKKREHAVALRLGDEQVPKVVAKGYGEIAERIIATAKSNGVYVHDAPELVGLLMELDLDQRIPEKLYQVIAELLAWVHYLNEAYGDGDLPPERLQNP